MKKLFILSSAVNSRFGKFSPAERLQQTLASIDSVKQHCPDAKIAVIEMAGTAIAEDQAKQIQAKVNYFFDFSKEQAVVDIYNSTDNWDIVKNTTEVMCFNNALTALKEQGILNEFDRIWKMSGRYILTNNFKNVDYELLQDRIVVLERKGSQFPPAVTGGMQYQYMSRLWSWPSKETEKIIDAYGEGFMAMAQRYADGGYFDIEHMLYAYLPKELVSEVPQVGLRGLLGPNGVAIED